MQGKVRRTVYTVVAPLRCGVRMKAKSDAEMISMVDKSNQGDKAISLSRCGTINLCSLSGANRNEYE